MFIQVDNRDPFAQVRIHDGTVFVARRVAGAQKVKIAALIGAGSLQDTRAGTAHFFEHLPFNITVNFKDGEIFRFFQDRGGYVNAFTAYDATVYHGEVQKDNFGDAIRGVAELVCKPVFEPKRIADEAKTIVTEWAMREGMQGVQRYARARRATLGDNDPHAVIGTPASIQAIDVEGLSAFYQRHYTNDNLIVYIQGDVEQTHLIEEGIKQFSLPRGLHTERFPVYAFRPATLPVPIPDAAATHTTILLPSPLFGTELTVNMAGRICEEMICSIEGNLLREVRFDKRLVYGIGISSDRTLSWGYDGIEFDAFPNKVAEVCEIVMRHLARLRSDPEQTLFESIRRNRILDIGDYITNNREQDPVEQVQRIRATGTVFPRDVYLNALPGLAVNDLVAYAAKYLVNGPLSVVYEGKIAPDFPDHQKLMAIRARSNVAATRAGARRRCPLLRAAGGQVGAALVAP